MTTSATTPPPAPVEPAAGSARRASAARVLSAIRQPVPPRALRRLVLTEAKLALREPAGLVWGVGLPVLLLVIFGRLPTFKQPKSRLGDLAPLTVYLPILLAMVLAMLALLAMPGLLAGYREQGVLRRMAATPASPLLVLAAQLAVNLVLALIALGLMLGIGAGAFGLGLPRQPAGFALTLALTAPALFSLGLCIAAVVPTWRVGQAVGGAVFFPLQFFAGLWVPRQVMPSGLRDVSDFTPLGAAVGALQDSIAGSFPTAKALLVMAGYAVVFGCLAVRWFSWE